MRVSRERLNTFPRILVADVYRQSVTFQVIFQCFDADGRYFYGPHFPMSLDDWDCTIFETGQLGPGDVVLYRWVSRIGRRSPVDHLTYHVLPQRRLPLCHGSLQRAY